MPPYEQLRRQLVDMIRSGVLAPGERLSPLRQLAGDLGLAVGTVARTYRELEEGGLVVTRRGGGTRVASTIAAMTSRQRRTALEGQADLYVRDARLRGADDEQLVAAVLRAVAGAQDGRAPDVPSSDVVAP